MESLNEVEKAAVQAFYENEGMRESVKKVLLAGIYEHVLSPGEKVDVLGNRAFWFVSHNMDKSNEVIGENTKTLYQGLNALEVSFNKLAEYKKVEPAEPKKNKAR